MVGQGQVANLKLDGQPTTLGTKFSAKLDQVAQLISFGSLYTYLAVLLLEITMVITNNSGGSNTYSWEKLYDIITGVILSFKAADVQLWEFTQTGGQAIWQTFYQKFAAFPDVQSDVTIASGAGGTATVYLKLPLTFFSPDLMDDQEDELIWAEFLVQSVIEFTLAGTGIFGSVGGTNTYTVLPTLSCYTVPRTTRYYPTIIRHTEQSTTNFAQDNIAVNGLFPVSLVLMPYQQTPGVTMKRFAAADFTSVSLVYDGTPIYSQINPTTMVALGKLFRQASADRVAQWEAGGNKMLVLASPDMFSGQKSKILFASKQPILKLVGGGGTVVGDFRVLIRAIVPTGKASAKAAFKAIGIDAADDELTPRFSFNPTADPSILQIVPWTYAPKKPAA